MPMAVPIHRQCLPDLVICGQNRRRSVGGFDRPLSCTASSAGQVLGWMIDPSLPSRKTARVEAALY